MNIAEVQEEEKLLTRLADARHQNSPKATSSQERPKEKRSLPPPEPSYWAIPTQPSQKDQSAEAARNEEPTSVEEGPRTPTQISGPSLATQNEELREKVGSLQATICDMSTQISGLIYNQINVATSATIAAEKKAKDEHLYGVWLIATAKDEWIALREKVGSLQATISGMSKQISSLIFKLNQIDFATLATIAAERKLKTTNLPRRLPKKRPQLPLLQ